MPRQCMPFSDGRGGYGFVCGPRQRTPKCACGRPSAKQCDYPIGKNRRTCSKHICERCTYTVGTVERLELDPLVRQVLRIGCDPEARASTTDTVDICPGHREQWERDREDAERAWAAREEAESKADVGERLLELALAGGC
jgi:hypothetical protein